MSFLHLTCPLCFTDLVKNVEMSNFYESALLMKYERAFQTFTTININPPRGNSQIINNTFGSKFLLFLSFVGYSSPIVVTVVVLCKCDLIPMELDVFT